jgi:hypothetical protein
VLGRRSGPTALLPHGRSTNVGLNSLAALDPIITTVHSTARFSTSPGLTPLNSNNSSRLVRATRRLLIGLRQSPAFAILDGLRYGANGFNSIR